MKIKTLLSAFSLAVSVSLHVNAQIEKLPMKEGIFEPDDSSLKEYEYPEWFRDAKFGIWSHWGPQAVPRQGDWYAKRMYVSNKYNWKEKKYTGEAEPAYHYHIKNYGHPSVFGYKDIIPLWKAERWKPDELMQLFKRVGARYFVSMAIHHDNFSLWDTKLNRWNSVSMGPKRDVVGDWQKAAKKYGLHFGVSEHLAASYTWFQPSHGADEKGDKAGIPYDGNNPEFWDLYHEKADPEDTGWMTKNVKFQKEWYFRIKELIDMYQPELLYSDSAVPFGNEVGRSLIAHYYNQSLDKHGKPEAVYTCKQESDGRFVQDVERGIREDISPYPWQTDTSLGDWYYRTGQKYKTSTQIIQMLVDVVSKNGNLLLNVVQTPEGDLEEDVLAELEGIAVWMKDNGEAIYGSRPWHVYGEGPSLSIKQEKGIFGGLKDVRSYLPGDVRFTRKGKNLYIFAMEHPDGNLEISSLPVDCKITSIKMLGSKEKIKWTRLSEKLSIQLPKKMPDYSTVVFKVEMKHD